MKYNHLFVFLILIQPVMGLAQNPTDSTNAQRAEQVISAVFNSKLDSVNYLVYNLEDKYLLIKEGDKEYSLFFIKNKLIEDSLSISKKNRILKKVFNHDICKPHSPSKPLTPHSHSRYIYFILKIHGEKHCEFNLPALFSENVKGVKVYPLNERVHKFLINEMFKHWKY